MTQSLNPIIVMPAFNEEDNIGETLKNISSSSPLSILVVDDASTDRTAEIASSHGAQVLSLTSQLGAWGATQAGIRYALKHGYKTTITFDADGQHDAQAIHLLLKKLKDDNVDMVIGACTSRGSFLRRVAWMCIRQLSGLTIRDLTSGFRAYSLSSMQVIAGPKATILDYQDVGVLCLLRSGGLKIAEMNVCMHSRRDGKSRIFDSWSAVFRYMVYSLLLSLAHFNLDGEK